MYIIYAHGSEMRYKEREREKKDGESDRRRVLRSKRKHHDEEGGKWRREMLSFLIFQSAGVQLYLCTVFITSFIVFCTSHKSLVFSVMLRVPAARNCLACSSNRVSRSRN